VIDYLSEDASPREMFLSRCGVEGILLALSSEGGAAGLRKFPFLKSEEDLLSVAESVVRAIEQDIELSVANILYSTSELARRVSVEPIGIISLSAFNDYAIKVLSACRKRWGTLDKISLVTHVSYYYQISEYIIPLPSGPDLSNLWESAWSAAIQDIEDFTPTYTDKQHISGVSEWIDLAVTIQENEPRFLRQLEYRTDCWIRVRKFLQMLILRLELDIKFENTSDCDEEDDNLEIFGSLLESNYVVLPELKVPLCELAIAINSAKDRVNEAREEIESAEQYENESMQEFQPQSDKYAGLSLQDKIIFSMQDMYSKTEDLFSDL
jgi:hypothetical protein